VVLGLCAALLLVAAGCGGDDASTPAGEGRAHVVTQYFGIFNDGKTDNFHACLDLHPPYELWDITFIAFVHTYEKGGKYVADYQNFRGLDAQNQPIPPAPGDTDRDRIRQLRQAALAVNPNMKFIVSLGWGIETNDFGNGANNPTEFAASVGAMVADNELDGFDVDFEKTSISESAFREVSQALRSELDTRGKAMGEKLYLTITPGELGFDMAVVNEHYDYLQMQSYDSSVDLEFKPENVVGHGVAGAKILFGRDIESGDTLKSKRYRIPDVVAYVTKNGLAGLMGWRVNAGSQMTGPTLFSGVKLLGQALPAD